MYLKHIYNKNVVSSANKTDIKSSDIFESSLIYKINNNLPSIDPCGR